MTVSQVNVKEDCVEDSVQVVVFALQQRYRSREFMLHPGVDTQPCSPAERGGGQGREGEAEMTAERRTGIVESG